MQLPGGWERSLHVPSVILGQAINDKMVEFGGPCRIEVSAGCDCVSAFKADKDASTSGDLRKNEELISVSASSWLTRTEAN